MNDLIERIEAASGPDREIDCAIGVAIGRFFTLPPKWEGGPVGYGYRGADGEERHPGHGGDQLVPRYTESVDAALTLVPEGRSWELTQVVSEGISIAFIWNMFEAGEGDSAEAATPALALCAAALKSRAYLKETNNG